jgi:hypothetical protein
VCARDRCFDDAAGILMVKAAIAPDGDRSRYGMFGALAQTTPLLLPMQIEQDDGAIAYRR